MSDNDLVFPLLLAATPAAISVRCAASPPAAVPVVAQVVDDEVVVKTFVAGLLASQPDRPTDEGR